MKKEKGITLIALVITIIILLILAGVTISLIWNGGIIDKSQQAVDIYSQKEQEEAELIDYIAEKMEIYTETTKDEWDGTIATGFENSSEENAGTKENPYTIKTAEQLAYFASQVNGGNDYSGKYIKLRANIELNPGKWTKDANGNVTFTSDAKQWTPIGSSSKIFKGTFDGNTHTISGLYINNETLKYQGLFGRNAGLIQNINIENSSVKCFENVAMLVGFNDHNGIIKNVNIKNGTIIGYNGTAGICGFTKGQVLQCKNFANVSYFVPEGEGKTVYGWRTGGICGNMSDDSKIEKCINYGNVTGTHNTGGVVGSGSGTISLCANYGTIKAEMSGGTGSANAGGIIGYASGADGSLTIINSYNIGKIEKTDNSNAMLGGIAGDATEYENTEVEFKNCYTIGKVNYTGPRIGGFLGYRSAKKGTITYTNCYWDSNCGAGVSIGTEVENRANEILAINESLETFTSKLGSEYVYNSVKGHPVLKWEM